MSLKGISPLVAVVMLIAFTLLVAGILGGLVTQFAQEQRAVVQYCSGARVMVLSGSYRESDSSVFMSVQNFGDVELTFAVLQTFSNGTVTKRPETLKLAASEVKQLQLEDVDISVMREFTLQSQECAGAQDFIRASALKKL